MLIKNSIIYLRSLLSSFSLPKLERKGVCLLKLKIDQKFTGLYGRTILVLCSAVYGKQINTQNFSSGIDLIDYNSQ